MEGHHKQKKRLLPAGSPYSGGGAGLYQQITSLVLARKFQTYWFKILFPEEADTAVRLGIKLGFAVVGLSTVTTFWGLLFLFLGGGPRSKYIIIA